MRACVACESASRDRGHSQTRVMTIRYWIGIAAQQMCLRSPQKCYYVSGNTTLLMVMKLKLRRVGNSIGMVLPKEALSRMNVGQNDVLYITPGPDGSFRITAADPAFGEQMNAAESLIRRYRNTLRELAR
jgi:putative addiction module antidote